MKQTTSRWHPANGAIIYYSSESNHSDYHQHNISLSQLRKLLPEYSSTSSAILNTGNSYNNYFNNSSFTSSSTSSTAFINDVLDFSIDTDSKYVDYASVLQNIERNCTHEVYTRLPIFYDSIKIPSKVATTVKRYIPKSMLHKIHSDFDVAVEMCLLYVSQLTSTYFTTKEGNTSDGWKGLKADYLRELITVDSTAYKRVREALEYPLKNGAIIECDYIAYQDKKSFYHRFGEAFIGKGIVTYQLKTDHAKRALNSYYSKRNKEGATNPIAQNLIRVYPSITLPTDEEILTEANRLVKAGHKNRKQKPLRFLNKKPKDYYKNPEQICFVEDALELFEYLKATFGRVISLGTSESGGRVVDMFTLMPSWIRKLVQIDGQTCIECDYSALHPNIAVSLYQGKTPYLTHNKLAAEFGVDVGLIKSEHLSFFNKEVWQMKESPLFEYYHSKEPQMLKNIIAEKQSNEYKYRITSRRMFTKEVEIMKDVIAELNKEGIYVLYVYDALLCHPDDAKKVNEIMNSTILKHGVRTTAKCSLSNCQLNMSPSLAPLVS